MLKLVDLEKKINSELTTKIRNSEIKHNQIYVEIEKDDLMEVVLFLKTNKNTRFSCCFLSKKIFISSSDLQNGST